MKWLICIVFLSLSLALAAQDHIIIPAGQDTLYRLKVTWFYGIDPIQTKDGTFIIPVQVLTDLQRFEAERKQVITQKGTVKSMPLELAKLPVKDVRLIELKETEAVIKK